MAQMRTVGQSLRETREQKGVSTRQVSNAIKIRESLIDALEQGKYDAFSSDMHLKSFLRSYASYLGLNEDMIMALYRRERRIDSVDGSGEYGKSILQSKPVFILSKYLTVKVIASILSILFTLGIFYFFFVQWKAFNTPPVLDIISPAQNDVLTSETFVIEGFTGDPGVKVLMDGSEASYIDSKGTWRINAKFNEPGIKRFQIIAENQFNKRTEKTLDIVFKPEAKVTKQKIRIDNTASLAQVLTIVKDATPEESLNIAPTSIIEIQYERSIEIRNFDNSVLKAYFNEDTSPTTALDSKRFLVIVENNRPVIKIIEDEKPKTTPQSTKSPTPTTGKTPIPTVSVRR